MEVAADEAAEALPCGDWDGVEGAAAGSMRTVLVDVEVRPDWSVAM